MQLEPPKFNVRLALLALALLGVLGLYLASRLAPVNPASPGVVEFEILPGWGASRVAAELKREELIRDATVFRLWLRVHNLDRSIGEGLYDLSPAMDAAEIARVLSRGGRPRVARVIIPEGFRAVDVAERLAAAGLGDRDVFLEIIQEPAALRPDYVPQEAGLEGYLFPASYEIPVRSTPQQILSLMVRRFEQEITPRVIAALGDYGLSVHDWVTLASIIQAEAGNAGEMPIIAGVFLNRLDRGMLLQADPTVAYGLGKRLNELDRFAGDFTEEADHPWNTYTRPGLPVGPIGNPGRTALRSIFSPQRTDDEGRDYLYFLHTRAREFKPNLTLEDHNRDVERYLR